MNAVSPDTLARAPLRDRPFTKPRATPHRSAPTPAPCPFLQGVGSAQPAWLEPLWPTACHWQAGGDARTAEVLKAYQRTGGLVSGEQMTHLLRRRTSQPISMLARWIVERRVVCFALQGEYLLPMFQFEQADLNVRGPVQAVLDEFDKTFDEWDLATWFALPNSWLDDEAPVDVLERDPQAVYQAARADRFIACG